MEETICKQPSIMILIICGGMSNRHVDPAVTYISRNLGIIVVLFAFVTCIYIAATEYVSLRGSKGEILLFLRKTLAAKQRTTDEESRISSRAASPRKVIELSERSDGRVRSGCEPFMWRSLSFDIPEKGNHRRLLHGVEGFVRPGTLTAVMVSSTAYSMERAKSRQ